MRKKGILFQGLCIQIRQSSDFLQKEGSYDPGGGDFVPKTEKKYADITYTLLYAIGKNHRCQNMVIHMEEEWRAYLLQRAESSVYQGEYFWHSLSCEEKLCAEAVLGLLEDIRGGEAERAELAWIGFWYLLYRGFQEIYNFFKGASHTSFQRMCALAKTKQREQLSGLGYLCIEFLFAEELEVEIEKNGTYSLLYTCMKNCEELWRSRKGR